MTGTQIPQDAEHGLSDRIQKSIAHQIFCDNTPHFDGLLIGKPSFEITKVQGKGDTVTIRLKTITGSEVRASVAFHELGPAPVSLSLCDTLKLPKPSDQSFCDRMKEVKRISKTVGKHYPALESIALANLTMIYGMPPTVI